MRKIPADELKIQLPPGFHFEEDDDVVCLFQGGTRIETFSAKGVDPQEIEKAAQKALTQEV